METEVQEQGSSPNEGRTLLESLDLSPLVPLLQSLGPGTLDARVLARCVKEVRSGQACAAEMDVLAQLWSQELLGHLGVPEQIKAVFVLESWLAPKLTSQEGQQLADTCRSLVVALSQFEQEQRKDREKRQSRLVMVGQLFGSIAHELRNPLAVMESSVFLLKKPLQDDPGGTRHLQKIARNVTRCHEIIHEVLEMVRDAPLRTQRLSALEIWKEVQSQNLSLGEITWEVQAPEELRVSCEPRLIRQCLLNLVNNSQVAMKGKGKLQCRSWAHETGEVMFEVRDTGPGFPSKWLKQGVQCLVSEHPNGHGLGLALAQSIAQRHQGRLELSNHPSGGAVVRVCIPRL